MALPQMMNDECGMMNLGQIESVPEVHSSFIIHHSSFDLEEEEAAYERSRLALNQIEELP